MTNVPIISPALFTNNWIDQCDKSRIIALIMQGKATSRLDLIKLLSIRSTTISEQVAQLLETRLLTETAAPSKGPGRPKQILVINHNRLIVLTFYIISQSIYITGINLAGNQLYNAHIVAPPDSDNNALIKLFHTLYQRILNEIPSGCEIAGISFSLPGLVDSARGQWIFSTRWTNMENLLMVDIFPQHTTYVARAMDAELRARLAQDNQSLLLLHWGFGIGMAFGTPTDHISSGGSSFGEVGHWRIQGQSLPCRCGLKGCLETVASYWALGPKLFGTEYQTDATEHDILTRIQPINLLQIPEITHALEHIVNTLINLCRIFFPEKIIISGPFVANPRLWSELWKKFHTERILTHLPQPELHIAQQSHDYEVFGATNPLMEQKLLSLFH